MRLPALPSSDALARIAVVLAVPGLLLLLPVHFSIHAAFVGMHMLGSMLVTLSIAIYLVTVVRALRQERIL